MAYFHEHHKTCHKGYYGKYRCRLAKKSGLRNGTNCVPLRLLDNVDEENIDEDYITETMLEESEYETNQEIDDTDRFDLYTYDTGENIEEKV